MPERTSRGEHGPQRAYRTEKTAPTAGRKGRNLLQGDFLSRWQKSVYDKIV